MFPLFFYIKFLLQMKSISIFIYALVLFSLFFSCQNIENENVQKETGKADVKEVEQNNQLTSDPKQTEKS